MIRHSLAILLAASLAGGVALASPTDPAGAGSHRLSVPGPVVHKLKNTTIDYGNGGALAAGFNTVDATTVTCPAASCTIGFGLMVQAGGQSTAGNRFAICALVDSATYANPGCPFQGELATDGTFSVGNSRQNLTVGKGVHKVAVQIYVDDPASLAEWEADYLLYTP